MQTDEVCMHLGERCLAGSRLSVAVYVYTGRNYIRALAADAVYWSQVEETLETQLWRSVALQILTSPEARCEMTAHGPAVHNNRRLALMENGRGL
jgi:hypothetical protein